MDLLVNNGSSGAAVRESNIVPIKNVQWRLSVFPRLGRYSVADSFFLSPGVMQTPGSHRSSFDSPLLHVIIRDVL